MNEAEIAAVLELAEAMTVTQRRSALDKLVTGRGMRVSADAKRRLHLLRQEVRADQLRPLNTNAPKGLVPLEAGPEPVLHAHIRNITDEWVDMWLAADQLREAGAAPPGPLLLHGPTGSGKTTLAAHIAGRLGETYSPYLLDAHRIVDSHMGSTGANLSEVFGWVSRNPVMLVIEEVDAISTIRSYEDSAATAEGNRITVALMRLIESASSPIILTTNRASALDAALLRRFEYQCEIATPSEESQRQILSRILQAPLTSQLPETLEEGVSIARRARRLAIINDENAATVFDRILNERRQVND